MNRGAIDAFRRSCREIGISGREFECYYDETKLQESREWTLAAGERLAAGWDSGSGTTDEHMPWWRYRVRERSASASEGETIGQSWLYFDEGDTARSDCFMLKTEAHAQAKQGRHVVSIVAGLAAARVAYLAVTGAHLSTLNRDVTKYAQLLVESVSDEAESRDVGGRYYFRPLKVCPSLQDEWATLVRDGIDITSVARSVVCLAAGAVEATVGGTVVSHIDTETQALYVEQDRLYQGSRYVRVEKGSSLYALECGVVLRSRDGVIRTCDCTAERIRGSTEERRPVVKLQKAIEAGARYKALVARQWWALILAIVLSLVIGHAEFNGESKVAKLVGQLETLENMLLAATVVIMAGAVVLSRVDWRGKVRLALSFYVLVEYLPPEFVTPDGYVSLVKNQMSYRVLSASDSCSICSGCLGRTSLTRGFTAGEIMQGPAVVTEDFIALGHGGKVVCNSIQPSGPSRWHNSWSKSTYIGVSRLVDSDDTVAGERR